MYIFFVDNQSINRKVFISKVGTKELYLVNDGSCLKFEDKFLNIKKICLLLFVTSWATFHVSNSFFFFLFVSISVFFSLSLAFFFFYFFLSLSLYVSFTISFSLSLAFFFLSLSFSFFRFLFMYSSCNKFQTIIRAGQPVV